jgi:hypothetical protein
MLAACRLAGLSALETSLFRRLPLPRPPLRLGDLVGVHKSSQGVAQFGSISITLRCRQVQPHKDGLKAYIAPIPPLSGGGARLTGRLKGLVGRSSPRGWRGVTKPGGICLSEQAYWQVKGRLDLKVTDLGLTQLKNIAEPIRVYAAG